MAEIVAGDVAIFVSVRGKIEEQSANALKDSIRAAVMATVTGAAGVRYIESVDVVMSQPCLAVDA